MRVYTIHEPPRPAADWADRAEELVFVRDGFSLLAFVATPVALALNRMWLLLIVYLAAVAVLAGSLWALGAPDELQSVIMAGLHLAFAWDFDALHRWTLARKGWSIVGTVTGRSHAECERRFFEAWLPAGVEPERSAP